MDRPFHHIATLNLKHGYFSNGNCTGFNFELPHETKRICNNLNLVIKPFDSGLYILCNTPELLENYHLPLRFQLNLRHSSFLNYTDLPPFNPGAYLLYFNNLSRKVDKAGTIALHLEEFVTGDNLSRVCAGRLPFGDFKGVEEIKVVDAWGVLQAAGSKDTINFQPFEFGFFELEGKKAHLSCCFFPQTIFRKPAGIIEIFPSALFEDKQPSGPVLYNIQFKHRQTIWRYILSDPLYSKFNHLQITDEKRSADIFQEKKVEINGLKNFKCFESLDLIPLTQHHEGYYQLIDTNGNNGRQVKILIKHLPQASPETIYQERTSIGVLYSHIFI